MSKTTTQNAMSLDDLIERIAATAFNTTLFTVYTNSKRVQHRAVKGQYPHLVVVGKVSARVEMVGMVETRISILWPFLGDRRDSPRRLFKFWQHDKPACRVDSDTE